MAVKQKYDYDIIVIGSGAAGNAAATLAARNGKRVAIVEADAFGGESSNWSDIPMGALAHAAQLFDEARYGSRFGLRTNMIGYNFPSLQAWRNVAITRTGAPESRRRYERDGIGVFHGRAHFVSPHEVAIGRRRLSAKYFVVATGARWVLPDIQGINTIKYLTPRTILHINRPPRSLYIAGGGATATEFAQLMATFGTKVYIANTAGRLLPDEDEDVGLFIEDMLAKKKGVTVLSQTRTLAVSRDGAGYRVVYLRGGVEQSVKVDQLLIVGDRTPEVDLGLENAGIEYDAEGVTVNEYLQTSAPHIYAAGEVAASGNGLTHTAFLEGKVVVNNILHPRSKLTPSYDTVPRVVFTNPTIASVGMTENECLKRDLRARIGVAPLSSIARSNVSDFRDGMVKITTDKKGVIIGATIVAPHAAEMIHELALAIRQGMHAEELADMPHAFLSWSEAIRVAAVRALK